MEEKMRKKRQSCNMGCSSWCPHHIPSAHLWLQLEWTDGQGASLHSCPGPSLIGLHKHSWEQGGVNALCPKMSWQINTSDSYHSGGQSQRHLGCFSAVLAETNPIPYSHNVPLSIPFLLFVFLLPHFFFMRSPSRNYLHKSLYFRLCFQGT